MKGLRYTVWVLCILLAACGCAARTIPLVNPADPKVSADVSGDEYRIQPGDQLDIKFFYSPELNEQLPVRPDGRIALQLAQEVRAAGLTPAELTAVLKEIYSKELKKPDVVVIVRSFGNQRVYVDGQVAKPGLIPLTGPTTILQAITQAGGFVYTGNSADVVLIRRGHKNEPVAMLVNIEKVYSGTDLGQDLYLKPFDIVYVPRTAITNANLWIEQYLTRMVPRIGFTAAYPVGSGVMGVDTSSTIVTPLR